MKKIITLIGVMSALWTTNSVAQFQDEIKKSILVALGSSNMSTVDEAELRLIIQDAVDNSVPEVLKAADKYAVADFLYRSGVTSQTTDTYFRKVFEKTFKPSADDLAEASQKLKSYFTNPVWRERIIGGLNKQIGHAIVYAYQSGFDAKRLALTALPKGTNRIKIVSVVQNTKSGNVFLALANQYFDDTVPTKKALLTVEDLLVERIPMKSNILVPRTTSDHADDFLQIINKFF